MDTYANLSLKTITGFRWASKYCKNTEYLFKTDDDLWMNFFHINNTMDQIITNDKTFYGNCFGSGYPHRSPSSKWYTPYRFYPLRWYGSFCLGSALLMRGRAVQIAAEVAEKVPYFHVEDVYISGLFLSVFYFNSRRFLSIAYWSCNISLKVIHTCI